MIRARAVLRISLVATVLVAAACQDLSEVSGPSGPIAADRAPGGPPQLAEWFQRASPEVLALDGTVFADHDEDNNRLVFGVERAGVATAVENVLARLGVPASAYTVQVTAPIYQLATLRDQFRPTQGGIQIHFSIYLCTLGFNVSHSGGRSFITNSHCTKRQGGTEGTQYYQPTSTVDPTVIGVEAADPQYFRGGVCPKGRKCRYSDSARILYSAGVASNQGDIGRTTGANNGDITVAGSFAVTAQDNTTTTFATGTVVNKVGRTTGWTQGTTGATCATVNVSGTSITQLCQTLVNAGVGGGDSGSPVFASTGGDNVTLVGILWGGSSDGSLFVFSPLKNIQDELGSVTATK